MNIRPKDPAKVRTDALRMASKKLAGGCRTCADAYLDLARRTGARAEQIGPFSRRIVQPARAVPVSGSLGISSKGPHNRIQAELEPVATNPMDVPDGEYVDPFGSDSNSAPIEGMTDFRYSPDFYVGRIGYGLTADTQYFNAAAASQAGRDYTYGYWGLQGPNVKPRPRDPYQWGRDQAAAALNARANNGYIGTYTIFADIENDTQITGWFTDGKADHQNSNRQVLNGFLDRIAEAYSPSTPFNAGVYIRLSITASWFGQNTPTQPFVLWATGTPICGQPNCMSATGCYPCDPNCDPKAWIQSEWNAVQSACWAGQGVSIWQFWLDSCDTRPLPACSRDFDYTPERFSNFHSRPLHWAPLPAISGPLRNS